MTPSGEIEALLKDSKSDRDSILVANGAYGSALYEEHKIVEAYLTNGLYDYFVTQAVMMITERVERGITILMVMIMLSVPMKMVRVHFQDLLRSSKVRMDNISTRF